MSKPRKQILKGTVRQPPRATAGEITIAVPDEESLGPHMRALTDARRAFCIAYVSLGAKEGCGSKACEIAGIGGTSESRKVSAYRLLRDPTITAALQELCLDWTVDSVFARGQLRYLMTCGVPDVELKACKEVLSRSHPVTKEHHVVVEHDTRSNDQLLADIEVARHRLGLLPPPSEAPYQAPIVDAEFLVVKPPDSGISGV